MSKIELTSKTVRVLKANGDLRGTVSKEKILPKGKYLFHILKEFPPRFGMLYPPTPISSNLIFLFLNAETDLIED